MAEKEQLVVYAAAYETLDGAWRFERHRRTTRG